MFVVHGIQNVAPVAAMFLFAILYFGIMTDAGMLDPIINGILRTVGVSPSRIGDGHGVTRLTGAPGWIGSGDISCDHSRDVASLRSAGDGSTNSCVRGIAGGGHQFSALDRADDPRFGSTASAGDRDLQSSDSVQLVGLAFVFAVSRWLGRREAKRLGLEGRKTGSEQIVTRHLTEQEQLLRRPRLFRINLCLTVGLVAAMIGLRLEPSVVFMCGLVLALTINYPNVKMQ